MAEICASSRRKNRAANVQSRGWDLVECSRGELQTVWVTFAADESIPFPSHRKKAGVIAVVLLKQDVERPLAPTNDGEIRSTVAEHSATGHIFEKPLRASYGFAELIRADPRDTPVIRAMRCHLVTAFAHFAHERRCPLGDPAQGKKSCARFVLCQ